MRAAPHRTFVAIDFETANNDRSSACAVALVRCEGGRVVRTAHRLVRPPTPVFSFTYLHGIAWPDVAGEPDFARVWPDLLPLLDGAAFLAAHNAPFDRSVLEACCAAHGIALPELPWLDTVRLARDTWSIFPTKLPHVCAHLGLPLEHHQALSDAQASAAIVLRAGADRIHGGDGRAARTCAGGARG